MSAAGSTPPPSIHEEAEEEAPVLELDEALFYNEYEEGPDAQRQLLPPTMFEFASPLGFPQLQELQPRSGPVNGPRSYSRNRFSDADVEQIQLTLRRLEVLSEIERLEVGLGYQITECVRSIQQISRLQAENERIRGRLNELSSGASRRSELQYQTRLQERMAEYLIRNPSFRRARRSFSRPLPHYLRPLQRLGHAFYTAPSLLVAGVWQAVLNVVFPASHA